MASVFKRNGVGSWVINYVDHRGKRRMKSARTTDKRAAQRIAAKLEADAALRRDGVIDVRQEAIQDEGRRPWREQLDDFKAKMQAAGRSGQHIRETVAMVKRVGEAAGWAAIADIDAQGLHNFVGTLQDKDLSARRIAAHITAAKAFTRWLVHQHRLAADPLVGVSKPSPRTDRRRERRMLLPDEWTWLRYATTNADTRYGMSGHERMLLYAVAIQTGLRVSELRSLTRARFFLGGKHPYIVAKAKNTKNRKDAKQYIHRELAMELVAHVATKAPAAPAFTWHDPDHSASMIRADLAEARAAWIEAAEQDPDEYERRTQSDFLAYENHEGEVLDFHSLRHTCGAWLSMNGAHPKAVQAIMRHSTITLTLDTYGHLMPGQEADAIARMPAMMGESIEVVTAAAGTG